MIGYYRVSTDRQGESGLGLEAQRAAVERYAAANGGTITAAYTETESGRRKDRPELRKALAQASLTGSRLVVAKLDRLARNTRFLLDLVESGADVAFCDFDIPPGAAGKMILTNMASVAEFVAGRIREDTRAGLARAKAKGVKLGSHRPGHWDGREQRRAEGQRRATAVASAARRAKAITRSAPVLPVVLRLRKEGLSYAAIAARLNDEGYLTARGKRWHAMQVLNVLRRVQQ